MFGKKNKKSQKNPPTTVSLGKITTRSLSAKCSNMKLLIGNAQHQGSRNYQEDSFGISDISTEALEAKGIFAVLADGMGGLSNGKEISQQTVTSLLNWFSTHWTANSTNENLKNYVVALNAELSRRFCNSDRINSGTTLVTAHIKDGFLNWLCVGDSRLYVKRNGKLYQVNEDHDYLNQLLSSVIDDTITLDMAMDNTQKDSLAACIGKEDLDVFDYSKQGFRLQNGDMLILCSDGVYNAFSHDEFNNLLQGDPMSVAENLKYRIQAKNIPHQDNNTVIIITYNEER